MMGAIKLLMASGGTDVAELPFFIGATYTGAYAPRVIRKVGTGKYMYTTDVNVISNSVADYERIMTTWWSPDGVIPVQSAFWEVPNSYDYIAQSRKVGGYTFSYAHVNSMEGNPYVPVDRINGEGWPAGDETGQSGLSTDAGVAWNNPNLNNGAQSVSSPDGSSGYRVFNMWEMGSEALDTARYGQDYSNVTYRFVNYENNNSGNDRMYIEKLNSSGVKQWGKTLYANGENPKKITQVIPLPNGKTFLHAPGADVQMLLDTDGTIDWQQKSDFAHTRAPECAVDSSGTYAYAVRVGYLYRLTLSTGAVDRLSIQSASSVPSNTPAGSATYQMIGGWDSDGYLWWGSNQYGMNRLDVSNASSPQIVGTYKTTGSAGYSYCTPHALCVDGDRVLIHTTGYANSTYDGYGGFFYCLKTDFSTTTVENYNGKQYNNRYGLNQIQGYSQGGFGAVTAYTTAQTGTWTSQSVTTGTYFGQFDRPSYDWATNAANYGTALSGSQYTSFLPMNTPVT